MLFQTFDVLFDVPSVMKFYKIVQHHHMAPQKSEMMSLKKFYFKQKLRPANF